MHIILLILKIIGIVLFIILGVLLFLLGLILFAPIRYKANFERKEAIFLKAMATWLFPLLIITASYENEVFLYHIKIFGIVIYPRKKRVQKKKKGSDVSKEPELVVTQIGGDNIPNDENIDNENVGNENIDNENIGNENIGNEKIGNKNASYDIKMQQKFEKQNKKLEDKINKKVNDKKVNDKKVNDKKVNDKKSKKRDNPEQKKLKETLYQMIDFIKVEENKKGFLKVWISLKGILKHVKPLKLSGRLVLGTGDPCSTGQILGVMGIFYAMYGNQILVIPDFERACLEGELFVKGRIRVFTLLYIGIKLLVDHNVKSLKRNFEKLKEVF